MADRDRGAPDKGPNISPRTIGAGVVAVLLVLFVALNRDTTNVSFIFFDAETSLWIALTIAGVLGAIVGFLLGRRMYRD